MACLRQARRENMTPNMVLGFQQIGILNLTTFEKRNASLTGAITGLYFTLSKFNLLASLNLLEKMCLKPVCSRLPIP